MTLELLIVLIFAGPLATCLAVMTFNFLLSEAADSSSPIESSFKGIAAECQTDPSINVTE